ncbi:6-phosphogluconolactonase [Nitrosomonas sp. PY1]|uniref:6-phosphogluconolactonase n=1 Tax=Nitrosomonas sp. PY1 TaxID=1803906 RepID=UPI001FC888E7|nr:6-phosphogluconolactonase [Nitrosomonas sp. PY1]GKS70049.1 6-phosphogluconolactonase [Nitrosomonas sp. PY1]
MKFSPQRHDFSSMKQLSEAFAEYASDVLEGALREKSLASLVVPGGNTPREYLPNLAKRSLSWERIVITLSDERWVDVTDEQSNENLVKKHFLNYLPQNTSFIGLKTDHDNPFTAVKTINQRLSKLPKPSSLTVLGMGKDGHIASLFPGMHFDLLATQHCVAVAPPIAPSLRVSLSLPLLGQSNHIALVVVGKAKQQLLNQLSEDIDSKLPIARLLQYARSQIDIFTTKD